MRWIVAALLAVLGSPAAAAPRTYAVTAAESLIEVHVGKAGAFSFAGHKHEVVAPELSGSVVADPEDLARSSVSVMFAANALRVTGKGEPAKDVPEVQQMMLGPKVLDSARHATIAFVSRSVSGRPAGNGAWDLEVTGDFGLRGVTRSLKLPMRIQIAGDVLTATGRTVIRHTDFGMEPVSAAGGTVKVKNEVAIDYKVVARASP